MKTKSKVSYFIDEVIQAAKHIARHGHVVARDAQITARLEKCGKCEKFTGSACSVCGCQMKWKTALASTSCPLGRW